MSPEQLLEGEGRVYTSQGGQSAYLTSEGGKKIVIPLYSTVRGFAFNYQDHTVEVQRVVSYGDEGLRYMVYIDNKVVMIGEFVRTFPSEEKAIECGKALLDAQEFLGSQGK